MNILSLISQRLDNYYQIKTNATVFEQCCRIRPPTKHGLDKPSRHREVFRSRGLTASIYRGAETNKSALTARPKPTTTGKPTSASGSTFLPTQEEPPTPNATYTSRRIWRRWRWTSPSPRRRRPATRPRRPRRGGAAPGERGCGSTTCSTSTTCSSRSGRRPTTSTASRPSATTSTPEVNLFPIPQTLESMCPLPRRGLVW